MKKFLTTASILASSLSFADVTRYIFEVPAATREERTYIANFGFALDEVQSDRVFISGTSYDRDLLNRSGLKFVERKYQDRWEKADLKAGTYRSYNSVVASLQNLASNHPEIASYMVLGKSFEGRDQPMLRISGVSPGQAESAKTPAILYQGCHHAREHLSVEVPLRFAEYLINNYASNESVKNLVDHREIFIAPIVNPDGFFFDYTNGISGKNWRKNRHPNSGGSMGVDLNRNYGFGWGGGGASDDPNNDTYRGPSSFSEIEIQNVRDFVKSKRHRMNSVMDFHSFSELILYPWGYQYDDISNAKDVQVYNKMAHQMASWNNYTAEQASDLYIASGVSVDYFYGELGMTAFTFELSPNSMFGGGFYLSPSKIESVFSSNLKPMLYMLEYADNPARVLTESVPSWLLNNLDQKTIKTASYEDLIER
ncbi:MAG: M14 family metallopeptidase [bacterium]